MKKIKLLIALTLYAFLIQECLSQSIIWSEDFPYDDGTTIGSGIPPNTSHGKQDDLLRSNLTFSAKLGIMKV